MRARRAERKRFDRVNGGFAAGRELEDAEPLVQRLLVLPQLGFLLFGEADQIGEPPRIVREDRQLAEGERFGRSAVARLHAQFVLPVGARNAVDEPLSVGREWRALRCELFPAAVFRRLEHSLLLRGRRHERRRRQHGDKTHTGDYGSLHRGPSKAWRDVTPFAPAHLVFCHNVRVPASETAALLNNRYRILRPIGRGGMGAVYEAIDLRLHNTVAVKEMTAGGDDANRAFEREARLLAALRHAALPVVSDYFIEHGARYLVMQYIEGEDLAALYRRTGRQAEGDVARWGVAVLRALVYLHDHAPPIVHRDIKPANIKLTPRGEIVLLDFGLAKGRLDRHETRVDVDEPSIYGFTPGYAPPEQLAGSGTDPRSDLYALGATLYHLAVGAPPPTATDRMAALAIGRPDMLTSTTSLSPHLGAVTGRALALDPAARFQSAREMLDALAGEAAPQPVDVRRPATRARRLDAAAASQAEVGREIDLLVQVRFSDSPRLGLEDWPTRRRPAQIEQVSDAVPVEYPVDAATGQRLPARLRIKLVAPDFDVRGASEQLIDVPPDEYSRRLAFLLAPRRLGYCRVNIEVYAAADAVFLGSVAVEAEALAALTGESDRRVAELALAVAAIPPAIDGIAADGSSDKTTPMDHRGPLNVPTLVGAVLGDRKRRPPDDATVGAPPDPATVAAHRAVDVPRGLCRDGAPGGDCVAVHGVDAHERSASDGRAKGRHRTHAERSGDSTGRVGTGSTAARHGEVRRAFAPAGAATPAPAPPPAMAPAPSPALPAPAAAPRPAVATAPPAPPPRWQPRRRPQRQRHHRPLRCRRSCRSRARAIVTCILQLVTIGRLRGGPLRATLRLVNQSASAVTMAIDPRDSRLTAAGARVRRRWDGTS